MPELSDVQRETLRVLCDTIVPSIERADDPDGFWARSATQMGADQGIIDALDTLKPEDRDGLLELLDVLASQDFNTVSQASREQLLLTNSLASMDAAIGIKLLTSLTLLVHYGAPDPQTGQNPNWKTLGFPGPAGAPPQEPKRLSPVVPEGDTTLDADVVVVGSGAGGGVIAAKLAEAGKRVVVVEAGGYFNEADFNQSELWAYQNLYWRGGLTPSADFNVTLLAGSCLGGGTVVNWTNSLKTKPWVREQWASEHGLEDVDSPEFDRHLDAVWERLGVNDRCSELNRSQQKMKDAADALGWNFDVCRRNWDPDKHDPRMAGLMGFGDQSGAKRSTLRTYLEDAAGHGAQILANTFVERVLVENGHAAGVEGVWTEMTPTGPGRTARVTVRAPQVVVAAGALESPAILLRSGIGGETVGKHLRLHPCTAMLGDYGEDMDSWWGAPHAGLINEFANVEDGYGFLLEGTQYTTALGASAIPFTTGTEHKALMADYNKYGMTIGLVRDHGGGRISLDEDRQAVVEYAMEDELDVRNSRRALEAQVRAHHAAGARRIVMLGAGMPTWRIGDDLEAFIARLQRMPLRAGGATLFAAHQMGTCRMGADPASSVADVRGELHDTPGVWIGDTSAFPTSSGTNPMITVMALASRTAENMLGGAGSSAGTSREEVAA